MVQIKRSRAEQLRKYRIEHPDKVRAGKRRYREKHPDRIKAEKKRYKKAHPEKGRTYMKRYNAKTRLEVLTHYSNGSMKCHNCGESHIEFLEIDHINGNGKQHKREVGYSGIGFYRWLRSNGFPEGYQVLCSNCNIKKVKIAARTKGEEGTDAQKRYYDRVLKLRNDLFNHYMINGKVRCSCPGCKVTDPDLLCMDHINNDGAEHRRSLGIDKITQGFKMYMWIKRNNYPASFRILCHNCNQSIGKYGYCPHEKNFSIFRFVKS